MSFPFSKATRVLQRQPWSPVLFKGPMHEGTARRPHALRQAPSTSCRRSSKCSASPPPAGLDGRSLGPLDKGGAAVAWIRTMYSTHVNTVSSGKSFPQRCVRTATNSYMWMAWPDGQPKFRVEAMSGLSFNALNAASKTDERIAGRVKQLLVGEREQFFDLKADPDEPQEPHPRYRPRLPRLHGCGKLLLEQMERTQDPQLAAYKKTLADNK